MSPRRLQTRIFFSIAACTLALLAGCATVEFVELREKPANPILERLAKSAFGGEKTSERTQRLLQLTSYSGGKNFAHMLHHARRQIGGQHNLDALHATAEISYLAAEKATGNDKALALELRFDAAKFSWKYLTTPMHDGALVDPNQAHHRETADVYNTSVQELLRMVKDSGDYKIGQPLRLPISKRTVDCEIPVPSPGLTRDQLGTFRFVADYEVKNLRNRHAQSGVGVPLIVKRAQTNHPLEGYYAEGLSFPTTAVLRFNENSADEDARLELYDTRDFSQVRVAANTLPLEADISTPLAWFLSDPKKSLLDTFAFFRTDKAQKLEGLYMVQPYDPNRIPVLMVHGIWSSPITWMEMFNDLQSDPTLRDKYQFWFYMYPTGQPLTFASAGLRDRLKELRLKCDPMGQNPTLDQMVVVGHSMGGLMSYLMTVDSEDKLWKAMSKVPVEQFEADETIRNEIRRVFFFESDRSIDRIVTIASPFNGSGYSNTFTRWLTGSLISLPETTSKLSQLIIRRNKQNMWDRMFASRTSVDSLNKDSAILRLVGQTTAPDDVHHHNIVGISKGKSMSDLTDGVVKFRSASRNDVDSEIKVKASHSEVHRHPETVAEVQRILLEHLQNLQSRGYPIKQVRHSRPDGWRNNARSTLLAP